VDLAFTKFEFNPLFFIDAWERNDNTIQIQNDQYLQRYIVMNERKGEQDIACFTAGGNSAMVARRSHIIP
jgi:hypothetical protein